MVIFDGIAGPQHLRPFESLDAVKEFELHRRRQRRRNAIGIDRRVVEPLRLEENLMRWASAKRTTLSSIEGQ